LVLPVPVSFTPVSSMSRCKDELYGEGRGEGRGGGEKGSWGF
jgi:hypothetical protein